MERSINQVHSKVIIHVDIDCFYAQVELLKRQHLQNEPVGVKQKNIVVTCNYVARSFGVKKCMLISEAMQVCPHLLLFNGEDLYRYRQASNEIHTLLLSFTNKVEKSGLDENYLDVTEVVKQQEENSKFLEKIQGHWFGDLSKNCVCGCHRRLSLGSQIAEKIRAKLKNELGFTSCCGISYNKVLAKLCCGAHKPNQQSTLFPNGTLKFLANLNEVEKIPGVGIKIKHLLETVNVRTVKDLQNIDLKNLKKVFKNEQTAINLKNLSLGICDSAVKQSGKPNSIGLEDGFPKIFLESDVKEKFKILLKRLMILVEEDGRIPMTIKVTVRKHDSERKVGHKETKQSPVPSCLFSCPPRKLTEESMNKLLNITMGLFSKMVNVSNPFHITLLGVAFSKFHEKINSRSVASFLLKKQDLAVQSITSLVSNETLVGETNLIAPIRSEPESDSESEPSPKKTKLEVIITKRNLNDNDVDMCSPSKLKVEDLNINGDVDFSNECPTHFDPAEFKALPQDLQQEIIREWKMCYPKLKPKSKCTKQSLIHMYCLPNNNNNI